MRAFREDSVARAEERSAKEEKDKHERRLHEIDMQQRQDARDAEQEERECKRQRQLQEHAAELEERRHSVNWRPRRVLKSTSTSAILLGRSWTRKPRSAKLSARSALRSAGHSASKHLKRASWTSQHNFWRAYSHQNDFNAIAIFTPLLWLAT